VASSDKALELLAGACALYEAARRAEGASAEDIAREFAGLVRLIARVEVSIDG
jgi:hypothetical protein